MRGGDPIQFDGNFPEDDFKQILASNSFTTHLQDAARDSLGAEIEDLSKQVTDINTGIDQNMDELLAGMDKFKEKVSRLERGTSQ